MFFHRGLAIGPSMKNRQPEQNSEILITKHIEKDALVKRLWQIQNKDDLDRMRLYLELYKSHDNYNLRCFVGAITSLPEIMCLSGKVAAISIPQGSSPRKMMATFHFRGKKEIECWEEYFTMIWDMSIPIKTGNKIDYTELVGVESKLSKLIETSDDNS